MKKQSKQTYLKTVLNELLYLRIKQLHLTFINNIYIQCDEVAMGSPLGSLLANIFMALEEDLIPNHVFEIGKDTSMTRMLILKQQMEFIIKK